MDVIVGLLIAAAVIYFIVWPIICALFWVALLIIVFPLRVLYEWQLMREERARQEEERRLLELVLVARLARGERITDR